MTQKKYGPFGQIIMSFVAVVKAKEYFALRRQKTGSKLLVAIIVAILTAMATCALYGVKLAGSQSLAELIEQIPEFSYSEGLLEVDGRYEYEYSGGYLLVDSDIPYFNYGNDVGKYDGAIDSMDILSELYERNNGTLTQALMMSKRNMVFVSNGQTQAIKYKDLFGIYGILSFSKQNIEDNYKNVIMKWALIIGALYIPIKFGLLFFVPLIYGLVGLIVASVLKTRSGFKTTYWMAFYMNVVFVIIKCLNPLLPVSASALFGRYKTLVRIILLAIVAFQMSRALSWEDDEALGIVPRDYYDRHEYADGTEYVLGGTYGLDMSEPESRTQQETTGSDTEF